MSLPLNHNTIPMAGRTFGRLEVIERADPPAGTSARRNRTAWWLCKCSCGAQTVKDGSRLRLGKTKSCGCSQKEASSGTIAAAREKRLFSAKLQSIEVVYPGSFWTIETIQQLRELWPQGISAAKIAARIGTSKGSVISKARNLDLPQRPSPIRTQGGGAAPMAVPSVPSAAIGPKKYTLPPLESVVLPLHDLFDAEPQPSRVLTMFVVAPVSRPVSRGGCFFPLWKHNERPKFRDGRPLLCGAAIERGSYCGEHTLICYEKLRVGEAA
jgi:hypothetical protein